MQLILTNYLLLADAVIITDQEHRIIHVNNQYEELTGYNQHNVIGSHAGILKSGLTPQKTYDGLKKALKANQAWSGIFINRKRNNELWNSFITISPIRVDEEMFYVGVFRDLNDISDGVYVSETRKSKIQYEILKVLALSCEIRDPLIEEHLYRVQDMTAGLIRSHNEKWSLGLTEEYMQNVINASIMHYIGKSGIPEGILYKPGKLSYYERNIIETHPLIGIDILNKISNELDDELFMQELLVAKQIVESHHEKWDGSGYPHHLKGDEIPFAAQVVSIVDVYDALTSRRAYKEAWPHENALLFISGQRGLAFNPDLVDTFLKGFSQQIRINSENLLEEIQ